MAQALDQDQPKVLPRWVEIRCSNPLCRTILTRYKVLPGAPSTPAVVQQLVCPDRRCRKTQTVELPPRRFDEG